MGHINFASKKGFFNSLESMKNLLSVKNLKEIQFNKLTMAIIVIALIVFMPIFGIIQKTRLSNYMSEKTSLQVQIKKLKEQAGGESVGSPNVRNAINVDYGNRILWSDVLNKLSTKFPPRIWLSSFAGGNKNTKSIELAGDAPDQSAVAGLIGSLKDLAIFADVKLLSSNTGGKAKGEFIQFKIEGKLK